MDDKKLRGGHCEFYAMPQETESISAYISVWQSAINDIQLMAMQWPYQYAQIIMAI